VSGFSARSVLFDIIGKDSFSPAARSAAASAEATAGAFGRLEKATARVGLLGGKMQTVGSSLTRKLTLPLLAVGALSIKTAMDFQKSMTLIQTAAGEPAKNIPALSAGIKKMAVDTGTSLSQLSEGMYTVAKAGGRRWSAVDQLTTLRAAAQGARAENVPLATSVSALTSVMMSYGLTAKDAVSTENAIIRGSGLAKTTMQEYAGALSTVIPVASAAGIKFSQVAGAIATLTQHGTSAQEATQELAFTIRNLQAPNNVAVAAMNQLGISSVNVSQNLGKRGLTGTLQYIESKLPHSGLVYLNTMKRMEAGTSDLSAMQSKMSPHLAALSTQFLKGSLSFADYRKAYRGLGAEGAAQGQAFATLAMKVKGYNDSVKNGTPQQKTMAAELKAIFGGATGLNTALQLGGHNLTFFRGATKSVSQAMADAQKNVEGWGKTTSTASFKMAQAKEKFEVAAETLGEKLMPVATRVIGVISKVADWFSHLSPGMQGAIVKFGLLAAAMGPVIGIVGRLLSTGARLASWGLTAARAVTNFITGLSGVTRAESQMSTRSYGMGARIGSSMIGGLRKALGGAVGGGIGGVLGIAAGDMVGKALGPSSLKGQLGSGLTKVLGGALGGFALSGGNPLGAVVGGGIGAFSAIKDAFEAPGKAAKAAAARGAAMVAQAVAETHASIQNALQSIASDNGAFGSSFQSQMSSAFMSGKGGNSLDIAQRAGINPNKLLQAATGNLSWQSIGKLNDQLARAASTGKITKKEFVGITNALGAQTNAAQNAEREYILYQRSLGKGILTTDQLGVSFRKLKAATASSGTSLDIHTAAGIRNREVLKENLDQINRNAEGEIRHHKNINDVSTAYEKQVGSLETNARHLGMNTKDVSTLIGTYAKMPKQVLTNLIKRGVVPANIQAIIDRYNAVPRSKTTTISAHVSGLEQVREAVNLLRAAQSKTVYLSTYTKAIHETINLDSSGRQNAGINYSRGALGRLFKAYAYGGIEEHLPMIAQTQPGRVRVFAEPETGGEAYIPLANDGRRPRAKAILSETARRLGGVATFDEGGFAAGDVISARYSRPARASRSSDVAKLAAAVCALASRPVDVYIDGEVVGQAAINSRGFEGVLDELSRMHQYG
jgi:hypothetical protein